MPRKILTCDDEKHIVRLIQVNLERQGYEVITAYNGAECLAKVAEDRPDLIVLDVMMPEMTGFEVLEALKKNPDTENIPVIMLTMKDDKKRGYGLGEANIITNHTFLDKEGCSRDELMHQVRDHLVDWAVPSGLNEDI